MHDTATTFDRNEIIDAINEDVIAVIGAGIVLQKIELRATLDCFPVSGVHKPQFIFLRKVDASRMAP